MQIFAIVVSFGFTVAALAMLVPAVRRLVEVIRSGQPASRTDRPGARAVTMLKEIFLHTRMLQWTVVGVMHWFVFAAFLFLATAVLAAFFQLVDPAFVWPIVGHWYPYEWFSEIIGLLSTVGIVYLIIYRQRHNPAREGRRSRFYGSTMWQAYFVEYAALLEGSAILFIRGAEYNLGVAEGHTDTATRAHFPIASWFGDALFPSSVDSLESIIYVIAMIKIVLAMIWLMVIARNLTMGVAWHRFTAFFNIFFKRNSDGSTALGAMAPLTSGGKAITLADIDELDEDSTLGVGKVEDFAWKGILDFTTCTECGRCQSQCPAWNTEKPLSPKLLITALRDNAYAKAPYLRAGGETSDTATALLEHDEDLAATVERSLIGSRSDDEQWFYNPDGGDFVIDEDVLWSCTSCGACVQQCPVDIEHVDHIMDMRRYQLLVEANFPAELNQLFKGLENKGNPWNMSPTARMEWAKGLDFEIPVVGEDLESLKSVDWLFWVGCAGAYEDRAKKTTRAVAELLNIAGISFGVLGNGETCTGDPARRAGNEFVFQGLAQQNVENFQQYQVKKVVSTCAHCFNTLKNEYADFGIELEVVHHTQLLNRLVREGKLTPVKDGAGAAKRSITYHDPCYLGRHNQVYSPPRELLQVLPGAEYAEMERHSERSFCCGAGGARMWMEENIGERININRTKEAVATGADQIAVACPFCRVMLSDGLTAEQAQGNAREEVEVLDVAQMLLASVKGNAATKAGPGTPPSSSTPSQPAAAPVSTATESPSVPTPRAGSSLFDDEPTPGAPTPSGGSSLFDDGPAGTPPAPTPSGSSSLFDEGPAEPNGAARSARPSGSSLFDDPAKPDEKPESAEQAAAGPTVTGSSLFDIGSDDAPAQVQQKANATDVPVDRAADPGLDRTADPAQDHAVGAEGESPGATNALGGPSSELGAGGSLFDIATSEPPGSSQSDAATESAPNEAEPSTEATTEAAAPAAPVPEPPETTPTLTETTTPAADATPGTGTSSAVAPTTDPIPATGAGTTPAATSAATNGKSPAAPATEIPDGGSLFDIPAPETLAPAAKTEPEPELEVHTPPSGAEPSEAAPSAAAGEDHPSGPDPTARSIPKTGPTPRADATIEESDSLFDL